MWPTLARLSVQNYKLENKITCERKSQTWLLTNFITADLTEQLICSPSIFIRRGFLTEIVGHNTRHVMVKSFGLEFYPCHEDKYSSIYTESIKKNEYCEIWIQMTERVVFFLTFYVKIAKWSILQSTQFVIGSMSWLQIKNKRPKH